MSREKPEKILWISFCRGLGDAVLMYPAFRKCCLMFPNAGIDVALQSNDAADVFRAYEFKGRILMIPKRPVKLIKWIIKYGVGGYHFVFDASSVEQKRISRIISFLFKRKHCVGYDYGSWSRLYSHRLNTELLKNGHMKDIYVNLLSPFTKKEKTVLEPFNALAGLHACNYLPNNSIRIVMHPGGRDSVSVFEKRWPLERFGMLAKKLLDTFEAHVVIIGSKAEREWIERGFKTNFDKRILNLAGKTSIIEMIECVRSGNLFIGNNSGPLHVAAACNKLLLTFAGGIPQHRWGVEKNERNIVLGEDKKCTHCTEYECDRQGKPCLEAITLEEAFNAASGLIVKHLLTVET